MDDQVLSQGTRIMKNYSTIEHLKDVFSTSQSSAKRTCFIYPHIPKQNRRLSLISQKEKRVSDNPNMIQNYGNITR